MANNRQNNILYIDTTGQVTTERDLKVKAIFFTPGAGGDSLELKETTSSSPMLYLEAPAGSSTETQFFEFADDAIIFQNGVYATITSGAKATLVVAPKGRRG